MRTEQEKIRKAIFGRLRTLRRKLHRQGIPCFYRRSVLSHTEGVTGFWITYRTNNTTLVPHLAVHTTNGRHQFDGPAFTLGIVELKELFGADKRTTEGSPDQASAAATA